MSTTDFKYDVAFSFLEEDEQLATQLHDRLKSRLTTFIYSERQLEVAGTDGEQTFNSVFGKDARSVVVLYRATWGSTPWTRIEETAIRNRGHDEGYDFVLFIPLEKPTTAPKWLPKNRLWIGLDRWGLDTAAAVIEARIQELGGSPHEETVEELAARLQRQGELSETRRKFLDSEEGVKAANAEFGQLCAEVKTQVDVLKRTMQIFSFTTKEDYRLLAVLGGGRTVSFTWDIRVCDTLNHAALYVTFWDGLMPTRGSLYNHQAQEMRTWTFEFDWHPETAFGWKGESRVFSTQRLVEHCLKRFLLDVQEFREEQQR